MDIDRKELEEVAERAAQLAAPVFEKFDWRWAGYLSPPSVADLRNRVREMLLDLARSPEPGFYIESGRFGVRRDEADGVIDVYLILGHVYSDGGES